MICLRLLPSERPCSLAPTTSLWTLSGKVEATPCSYVYFAAGRRTLCHDKHSDLEFNPTLWTALHKTLGAGKSPEDRSYGHRQKYTRRIAAADNRNLTKNMAPFVRRSGTVAHKGALGVVEIAAGSFDPVFAHPGHLSRPGTSKMLHVHRSGLTARKSESSAYRPLSASVPMGRRILYATPEMADFVKTGGLGEVSAALPRALRAHYDVRVLIPGYPQVRAAFPDMPVVARLEGLAGIPACDLGLAETADGLRVYVLIAPELYERSGTPYGDSSGISRTTTCASPA